LKGAFVEWARACLVPLSEGLDTFGEMIGDATVVALGEGVHCAAEPLEFRNRVLEHLARTKSFTAIAIESGLVESRAVHDYVRGGPGGTDAALSQGLSWNFDRLPQNRQLIEWLRNSNADPRQVRKLNFYGFDVAGSPGNPQANRGIDTSLVEAQRYLQRVDATQAGTFSDRFAPAIANLRPDRYGGLKEAQRDALTAAIADLIAIFKRKEAQFIERSSAQEYKWALRAAIGARQVDDWLRRIPPGWQSEKGSVDACASLFAAQMDVRDRAQVDNLEWILGEEGESAKILLFAHCGHLSNAPVQIAWLPAGAPRQQQVAGTYLRRRLGRRLLTIGHCFGMGSAGCDDVARTFEGAPADSLADIAGEVGVADYLLDLRRAPADIGSWLRQERAFGHEPHLFKTSVGQAFDVLFYTARIKPACRITAHSQTP
jgi:erythromycin esterase